MPSARIRIPTKVEAEILFRSDHTCSVCRTRYKDVQLHHIDGNHSNNDADNLIVVCLDCHSRVTGTRGLGKAYTVGEVQRYKRNWEASVRATRSAHRSVSSKRQKQLISQIDLIVCEILACKKDIARAGQLLDLLYELNLWRGSRQITNSIVEGLRHLALMTGLGSPRISGRVAETLWQVCWHFVGPEDVRMNKHDLALVLDCIDALGTLAEFNCMIGHGRDAAAITAEQLENFFKVGLWYGKQRIANGVIKACEEARKECYTRNKIDFRPGLISLRKSARKMRRWSIKEQPTWRKQIRRVERFLEL